MPSFTQPPVTKAVSSHGLVVRANGQPIGGIHQWAPRMARGATHVYEFGQATDANAGSGEPFDVVPGNVTGLEITIGRYDIYKARFERVFGSQDLVMLTNQTIPIDFVEVQFSPDGTLNETFNYIGAWFTNLGKTFATTDNRLVMVNGSAAFQLKRRAG